MKSKFLVWIIAILLIFMLSACNLPEVTPPSTEEVPSATPEFQTPPLPTIATKTEVKPLVKIDESNVQLLAPALKAPVSNALQITWTNDGKSLSVITQNSDTAGNQVYGLTTLNANDLSPLHVYSSSGDRIAAVAADGRTAAVISQDMNSFKLVDVGADNVEIFNKTPGYLIGNISFSPDLRYFAVTKAEAWEVVLFNLATNEELKTLTGFETAAPVFNAEFKESPQWMVWHARATIQLQDVETGVMGSTFSHQDFVLTYALSPDGIILASAVGNSVKLWEAATGSETRQLEIGNNINALSFSPDGKLLAVGAGNDVQIWSLSSGTRLTTLSGHSDMVRLATFSPDQKSIASFGLDNQLYLWQISE